MPCEVSAGHTPETGMILGTEEEMVERGANMMRGSLNKE